MKFYGLQVKFVAHPGKRDELVAILLQAAELLRSNKECIYYLVSTTDSPDDVLITETWTTRTAHIASLEPDAIRAVVRQAVPLIASPPSKIELDVVGGKGL